MLPTRSSPKNTGRRNVAWAVLRRRNVAWAVLLCFFASGTSGLIYQVVWMREMVLVFGTTTFATSTVLAVFMGGLALGSYHIGRRSERIARPLRLYGLLELGIGLYGLSIPFLFTLLPHIYAPLAKPLHFSFFLLSIVRFVLAALILITPTTLMGATLPVLASYYARDSEPIGMRVGSLYASNTFGAVAGAAAGGFALIPTLGMHATITVAAAINLLLGLAALALARTEEPAPAQGEQQAPRAGRRSVREKQAKSRPPARDKKRRGDAAPAPRPEAQKIVGPATARIVLAAFALSGFAALSYEVIWSRVLTLIIGSSVYAFSIMLTTFLIGLAVGASLASRVVDRIGKPVVAFAAIEMGIGITSLAGAYVFNELPYIFVSLYRALAEVPFGVLLLTRFLVASLVILTPTVLLGTLFPLVVRIFYGSAPVSDERVPSSRAPKADSLQADSLQAGLLRRAVGDVYAFNTLGAIAGALASGFLLIPWLGLLNSLRLSVALNLLIAAALFWASRPLRAATVGMASAAALLPFLLLFEPPWDASVMSSGVFRLAPAIGKMSREDFFDYFRLGARGDTIFYKEGITATVAVQESEGERVLKINGKPDASSGIDLPTQVLLGELPLLGRTKAENALVIGLGSGMTLGSVERFPLKQITCVEVEPAVIEASHYFDDVNNRPLDDPRLRLVVDDGRNFLDRTGEKFDAIIAEPSNPWITGVANLFTVEYFTRSLQRLKEDGVFCQWLQMYEMHPEDIKTLIATMRAAFPYVSLFRAGEADVVLLGSKRPFSLDPSAVDVHLADPKIAADLRRVHINGTADLLALLHLGPDQLARFSAGAMLNTDDNALIEFRAPARVGNGEQTVARNFEELFKYAAKQSAPSASAPPADRGAGRY